MFICVSVFWRRLGKYSARRGLKNWMIVDEVRFECIWRSDFSFFGNCAKILIKNPYENRKMASLYCSDDCNCTIFTICTIVTAHGFPRIFTQTEAKHSFFLLHFKIAIAGYALKLQKKMFAFPSRFQRYLLFKKNIYYLLFQKTVLLNRDSASVSQFSFFLQFETITSVSRTKVQIKPHLYV